MSNENEKETLEASQQKFRSGGWYTHQVAPYSGQHSIHLYSKTKSSCLKPSNGLHSKPEVASEMSA